MITILIANSLADVTTAALATQYYGNIFTRFNLSGGLGFSIGIALATIAILIFGEIIPKNMAKGAVKDFLNQPYGYQYYFLSFLSIGYIS